MYGIRQCIYSRGHFTYTSEVDAKFTRKDELIAILNIVSKAEQIIVSKGEQIILKRDMVLSKFNSNTFRLHCAASSQL